MKQLFAPFILLTIFITSCDSNRFFEENREITDGVWNMKQRLTFEFDVPDTTTAYNLYYNVRTNDDYPYSNLYVFQHIDFPNGKKGSDTIELLLVNPDGSWVGTGQGDLHDCQLLFRKNVRFPVSGKYRMEVEQAMRMEQLPGVKDVGIRIEKAE